MKHVLTCMFILALLCIGGMQKNVMAAPVWNAPTYVIQPNGDTLHCFISGDEYYQRIHDANNYTILKNQQTQYYVYAMMQNEELVPSNHIVGTVDPSTLGIEAGLTISEEKMALCLKQFDMPAGYQPKAHTAESNSGVLNNVVIFIRFNDDDDISTPFSSVEKMYNDSTANAVSVFNYYQAATYKKLRILTHFYPKPQGNAIASYKDIHPRAYYCPYDSIGNPTGYNGSTERREREFDMLQRATEYVDSLQIVPDDLNLDKDNDGLIDNISYIVKGNVGDWNSLLWPHKWGITGRNVTLNGVKVSTFNFILEGAGQHYFSTSTICHELFHALGAPDLYHYNSYTNTSPTGSWDIMERNTTPPQHMGAYMKFKYGMWIDSIPTLTESGTYALHSVGDPRNQNNCYKILSSDENQYYVLEFRDRQQPFESALPGTGMLVYRIDTRFNGNADFDKQHWFDEVYIFRPNGNDTVIGYVDNANLSDVVGRTTFDYTTNPYPTLTGNIRDSSFIIKNIHIDGDSIIFDYIKNSSCYMPRSLNTENIQGTTADISWEGSSDHYLVEYVNLTDNTENSITIDSNHYHFTDLVMGNSYKWRLTGICNATEFNPQDSSFNTSWQYFKTMPCDQTTYHSLGKDIFAEKIVPFNTERKFSYTQQLFSATEMKNTPMNILKIAFEYVGEEQLYGKDDLDIYMGHVNKTVFDSREDMVPIEELTLVYSGAIKCKKGWHNIMLDSAFAYDGVHDLILAIDDNSGWGLENAKFRSSSTDKYNTIAYYSNTKNPDPSNLSEFNKSNNRKKFRSNIRFIGCDDSDDNGGDTTSIEIADEYNVSIVAHNLQVRITSESMHTYTLFDTMGKQIDQAENQSSCTLNVPQMGIYILRIDNQRTKKLVVY